MSERILGPQGSQRRRRFLWVPMLAITALALFIIAGAQAVHDTGIFQLDRNAVASVDAGVVPATHDWDQVCKDATATATIPLCTLTSGSAGAAAVSFDTDAPNAAGNDPTVFTGGGSKDFADIQPSWLYKDGSTPGKDDLAHGFAARYSAATDTTAPTLCPSGTNPTCELLFFGADRTDASGDSQIGFWFYQNRIGLTTTASNGGFNFSGIHKDGDILVLSDFTQGGGTPNIKVFEWNFDPTPGTNPADDGAIAGGGNGSCKVVNGDKVCDDLTVLGGSSTTPADCIGPPSVGTGDGFCATVNAVTTSSPWPFTDKSNSTSFLPGEFYEGGINLSLLPSGLASECFSSFSVETRSSATPDAVLKDFVLGNFGNCTTTMTTAVSSASANPGTAVHDTATIVGSQTTKTPTGVVTFFLCSYASGTTGVSCDGTTGNVGTQLTNVAPQGNLSGSGGTASADSPDVNTAASPLDPGHYCFRAEWPGDTNYTTPVKEFSALTECFEVLQSGTTTVTEPRLASNSTAITTSIPIDTHVVDHALITGAAGFGLPTGSVAFFICKPGETGGTAGSETCPDPNGTALTGNPRTATTVLNSTTQTEATSSPDVVANVVGVWCFRAVYTPDTNHYTGSSDANHTECFTVQDSASQTTHQIWLPNDRATITTAGGTAVSGTVTFELYSGSTCSGTKLWPQAGDPAGTGVQTLSGAASPATTDPTNNTAVKVETDATVSWKVTFASTNSLVTSPASATCEISALDLTPNQP